MTREELLEILGVRAAEHAEVEASKAPLHWAVEYEKDEDGKVLPDPGRIRTLVSLVTPSTLCCGYCDAAHDWSDYVPVGLERLDGWAGGHMELVGFVGDPVETPLPQFGDGTPGVTLDTEPE